MKLILPVLALLGLSNALVAKKRASDSCSTTAVSCHLSGTVDTCCSPKYGLVVLALQWSPGYGPADEFTIHGLWPDTCSGAYAPSSGCDSSRNWSNISTIVNSMDKTVYNRMTTFWPSNQGDNNVFWSHEWTKHGTCVSTLSPSCYGTSYQKYQDVIEYFKKVLDLRDQYDLFGALNLNGVSPGGTYNVETIRQAIKATYGANAKLDCTSGALTDVSLNFYVQGRSGYQITEDYIKSGSCSGAVYFPKK